MQNTVAKSFRTWTPTTLLIGVFGLAGCASRNPATNSPGAIHKLPPLRKPPSRSIECKFNG